MLEKAHQHEFENPPLFTRLQRQTCFQLDEQTKQLLKQLESPINQAGFLIQLGYFRATTRFFAPSRFRPKDWGLSSIDCVYPDYGFALTPTLCRRPVITAS